jgi:excisionase family DNA binding protein
MTYHEVGRRLGKSVRTVSRLVSSGQLRTVGNGRGQRVTRDDLDAYINRTTIENRSSDDDSHLPLAATRPATSPNATPQPDTQASGGTGD